MSKEGRTPLCHPGVRHSRSDTKGQPGSSSCSSSARPPAVHRGFSHVHPNQTCCCSPLSSLQRDGEKLPFWGSPGTPSSSQLCGNAPFGACSYAEGLQHQDTFQLHRDLAGARCTQTSPFRRSPRTLLLLICKDALIPSVPSRHISPESRPCPLSWGRPCAQGLRCSAGDRFRKSLTALQSNRLCVCFFAHYIFKQLKCCLLQQLLQSLAGSVGQSQNDLSSALAAEAKAPIFTADTDLSMQCPTRISHQLVVQM